MRKHGIKGDYDRPNEPYEQGSDLTPQMQDLLNEVRKTSQIVRAVFGDEPDSAIRVWNPQRLTIPANTLNLTRQLDPVPAWILFQNVTGVDIDVTMGERFNFSNSFVINERRFTPVANTQGARAVSFRNNTATDCDFVFISAWRI